MGLDMYLYLRKSDYKAESKWDKPGQGDVCEYPKELEGFESEILARNFKSIETSVDYQVGYWRKANAIHKWFVDVCADGVDECQPIYVSLEKVKTLRNLCDRVLGARELAQKLLPTGAGFFFGGTEYDDWYYDNVEYTRDLLNDVIEFLDEHNDYRVIYQANW